MMVFYEEMRFFAMIGVKVGNFVKENPTRKRGTLL